MSSSTSPAAAGARRWPVRLLLIGVVFALVLPGLVFACVLIDRITAVERTRSEEAATGTALRVAEAMDRELGNLGTALRALATSPTLAAGGPLDGADLAAFAAQARATASPGQVFVLTDARGQQLLNTSQPPGTPLPAMTDLVALRQAVETRQTVVSNLFVSALTGRYSVMVLHPVSIRGRVVYVLALNLQPAYLSRLIGMQGLPPGWRASVVDGNGKIIARSVDGDRYVGQPAPSGLASRPAGDHDLRTGTSLDGDQVLVATRQMRMADWRVGVGVPTHLIEAPQRATLRWLLITGLFTLAVASLLAWQLARSVARPLHRLARAGNDLALGLPAVAVQSRIAEVDSVSRALVRATHDLRERAEALAAERAQLRAVIETVPVGLVIAKPDGSVVAGNSRLDTMLGHSPNRGAALHEHHDWIAHHGDGRPVLPAEFPLTRVLQGAASATLQCLYQRGDGNEIWVRVVAAPILHANGTIAGGVAALVDMDEVVRAREEQARFAERLEHQVVERTAAAEAANQRLRDEMVARAAAEEQLYQAQKMEAVGQLTGGLAHDFNNLLTVVMGSLDLLRRRAEDDRSKRLIDNALDGATRAATLTARLLAFSRRQPLMPQAVDLNRLVNGMSDLLHRTLGEAIQLETVLAGGVWQTHADPNQLENALLNLVVNGRDAIVSARVEAIGPEPCAVADVAMAQGRLTISTGNARLGQDFASHDKEFQPGDYIRVAVDDNGTGMPPEVVARVFEPFFTTKPQGKGTGLGLSQVHGFVKQSGGLVTIDTVPGQATTVSIYLPRMATDCAVESEPEAEPAPARHPGMLTVLVVEDDIGVRRFSVEALRELGHVVLEAGLGGEALRLLDAHPEIDVLLTDVVLPVMNGPRLAHEARRRRPGLPVLFASGYTGTAAMNEGLLPDGAPLLQKPFSLEALAAKLNEVLTPPESGKPPEA